MKRSVLIDNLRGFLIVNVVFVHYFGAGFVYTNQSSFLANAVYIFQTTFHMPLFAFVSGYLSKNVVNSHKFAVVNFLLPYLLFNSVFNLMTGNTGNILSPYGIMWYLLALFFWRYLLRYLVEIKHIVLISAVAAVLARFVLDQNYTIVIKILTITPFFLVGYFTEPDRLNMIRRMPRWPIALVITMCFILVVIQSYFNVFTYKLPLFTRSLDLDMQGLYWLLGELASIAMGIFLSIGVINIMSEKIGMLTRFGLGSFQIYLFHNTPYFRELIRSINPVGDIALLSFLYWMLWVFIISMLLSQSSFVSGFNKIFIRVRSLII